MLLVYGDESLDQTQSRVCAVAGIIGTEKMWNDLEPKWIERNAGIPFHATDCESDHGDYQDRPHSENQYLYRDLTVLLADSGLGGYASAQDLAAQRRAFPSPYEPPLYYQGFLDVLDAMHNAALDCDEIAQFTFDSRIGCQFNATEIYAYLQQSGLSQEVKLASKLSFDSAKTNSRIQTADLLAHEAMKELDNQIGPVKRKVRRSWECLKDTGRFVIEVFGEEHFNDPNIQPAAILPVLGFTEADYANWLEQKRVPPCYTSFLKFLFGRRDALTEEQASHLARIQPPRRFAR